MPQARSEISHRLSTLTTFRPPHSRLRIHAALMQWNSRRRIFPLLLRSSIGAAARTPQHLRSTSPTPLHLCHTSRAAALWSQHSCCSCRIFAVLRCSSRAAAFTLLCCSSHTAAVQGEGGGRGGPVFEKGYFGVDGGLVINVHIPERGVWWWSKEQGLEVGLWAKRDPILAKKRPHPGKNCQKAWKVGKSALELGGQNSIIASVGKWLTVVAAKKYLWLQNYKPKYNRT